MTTHPQVETVSTGADKAKLAGAVLLVVGSVVAYYYLGKQDLWLRVVVLLLFPAISLGPIVEHFLMLNSNKLF